MSIQDSITTTRLNFLLPVYCLIGLEVFCGLMEGRESLLIVYTWNLYLMLLVLIGSTCCLRLER